MWIEGEISDSLLSPKALGILALVGVRQSGTGFVGLDELGRTLREPLD